jgi:hypothetical protein
VAEWLRRGLQILAPRFDSGRGLQQIKDFWAFANNVGNPRKIPGPTWAAGERTLKAWIGWITYLPPNLAARAKYPADVEVEALEDGAALVTLCEEPFAKTDAEGMMRLRALEAALRPIQT